MTAMAFAGLGTLGGIAHADALTKARRDKLGPDAILALMKKGNMRFYTGKREDTNFLAQQRATAKGQYPAAILLTCILTGFGRDGPGPPYRRHLGGAPLLVGRS